MTRVVWNSPGERFFETGVDRGMIYFDDGPSPAPWNGLLNVTEKPSGGAPTPYYIDGIKYANITEIDEFAASIEAYTYPDVFALCDGTATHAKGGLSFGQQDRLPFHLSYRTRVGNDIEGTDHGYLLHIIYGVTAAPTTKSYSAIGENVDPSSFVWELATVPAQIEGFRPTSHAIIDSRKTDPYLLRFIEDVLYGTASTPPYLATPNFLKQQFDTWKTLTVTDNGDGTWTATGPDEVVYMTSPTEFIIDWKSASYIDANTYTLTTL